MNVFKAITTGLFLWIALPGYAQNLIPKPPIHLLHVNELALSRYAKIWVKDSIDLNSYARHEQLPNQRLPAYIKPVDQSVSLIVDSVNMTKRFYREAFLVNTTNDTVLIKRADATLADIRTEVYTKGQWLVLQKDRGSSCGNSYWTMRLAPKHYLVLQIEELPESGSEQVSCRIILKADGKDLVSNPITVQLFPALLNLAGTAFSDPWK